MFIDTHCHLQLKEFDEDRTSVIGNAKKAGVKKMIVPGVDEYSSHLAIELAKKYPETIYPAIGFHPYEASHSPNLSHIQSMLTHASLPTPHNSVIAIGEIGLDYHLFKGEKAEGKKQEQRMLFEEQLRIALFYHLPVIMHCRDAYEDFFSVLDSLPSMPRGVIHCFSGGLQELRFANERNLYIGIDGNSTYSKMLQIVIPHIPDASLLLETDAPYLTPTPYRGQRNEPKHIPRIASFIAECTHKTTQQISDQTTANAKLLFEISDPS